MRVKREVEKKRPELISRKGVVFHHDYAKPHTYLATQQILRELSGSDNRVFTQAQRWSGLLTTVVTEVMVTVGTNEQLNAISKTHSEWFKL
ncbi:hypothetical protein EVAR_27222_1 [Eumeta japonica]|uniref:Histone-lysine N-methyltransferase SETMAR n=1 Tax=Eumeta variegata TaxID=151549 RepID=A0A4C1VXB6_EUMVA|nr:hypothetical protein EVAR_27222_1 [Eumeta japonica]